MIESSAFYISALRKHFTTYCSDKLSKMGLTYGQLYIIIFVGKKQKCSPKDISLALRLDLGQLNRTLSKLIENNFVLQEKNEKDKRSNVISLTKHGEDIFRESYNLFHKWDKLVLDSLTDIEKQTFIELIRKVALSQYEKEKK